MEHLYVAYDLEQEKMRCASLTLVIKNGSLRLKYPGGLKGFLEKYRARCNRYITVSCTMSGPEFFDEVDDIGDHGLKLDEDFWAFDFWNYGVAVASHPEGKIQPHEVDTRVGWLRCAFLERKPDRGFYVWHVDEPPRQ